MFVGCQSVVVCGVSNCHCLWGVNLSLSVGCQSVVVCGVSICVFFLCHPYPGIYMPKNLLQIGLCIEQVFSIRYDTICLAAISDLLDEQIV